MPKRSKITSVEYKFGKMTIMTICAFGSAIFGYKTQEIYVTTDRHPHMHEYQYDELSLLASFYRNDGLYRVFEVNIKKWWHYLMFWK